MQAWNYRVWLTDTLRPSQYGVGQMNTLSVFFMTEQEVGWTMELLLSVQHQHTAVRKVGSLTSVETEIWAAWLKQVDQFSKALRNTVLYTRSTQDIGENGIELLRPSHLCNLHLRVEHGWGPWNSVPDIVPSSTVRKTQSSKHATSDAALPRCASCFLRRCWMTVFMSLLMFAECAVFLWPGCWCDHHCASHTSCVNGCLKRKCGACGRRHKEPNSRA